MKRSILVFLLFGLVSFGIAQERTWNLHFDQEGCYLYLNGATNVNKFSCAYSIDPLVDKTKVISENQKQGYLFFHQALLKVEVKRLDCERSLMTKEMRDLLQAEKYPYLMIELQDLIFDRASTDIQSFSGKMNTMMIIAGQNKEVILPVNIVALAEGYMVKGSTVVDITEFGLEPPVKMLGTVKVKKEIEIHVAFKAN
ncbi:YceI family protein [Algivirga pacifica]|uniref:Lipid/polyisoprenoid-binding YceI-like domain-containing protein n=1 Tax=Algivirga pacifica TaxID=1162670 RepID=A0ABP9DNW2_9BACT